MGEKIIAPRKERSDKKRDCKPTVPAALYETLDRVSYITMQPIKSVAESLLEESFQSDIVIEYFAPELMRDLWIGNKMYVGHAVQNDYSGKVIRVPHPKTKLNMRLTKHIYNQLESFAYAIGKTPTSTAGEIIRVACQETPLLQRHIEQSIMDTLDYNRRQQLKEVLRFIHECNPEAVQFSFLNLLDSIIAKFRSKTNSLAEAVDAYLNDWSEDE
ncbi:hypothetical protein DH09_01185 (plasmid) [Bacillaceae bacterium JMAK1]|nr:hypothetical protein DH09_01185 [Bacillaceae bacterium JMAK1]